MRWWLPFLLLLTSCGYRFEGPSHLSEAKTVTIPYVRGDVEGKLTGALTRALSHSGYFECVQQGGELTLEVTITGNDNERIGYRYQRDNTTAKLQHNLTGVENRRSIFAQVTLIQTATQDIIMGPLDVSASVDFDYIDSGSPRELAFTNTQGMRETTIDFSLGQLDSIEGAADDASNPLYRRLSQKILDTIIAYSW